LIKDCIQELFIDLWKRRNTLGTTHSIKFYLLKSFRRKIIYEAKRSGRFIYTDEHKPLGEAITVNLPYELPHVTAHMEQAQQQKLLHALEALPKRQREVIHLLFFDNFTRDEVASLMDIDLSSVYTLTWKALQSLKSKLLSANPLVVFSSILLLIALFLFMG
jgi:RNA polymerase sigma factor (sigma-70 family)